jgi:hypothetical protein
MKEQTIEYQTNMYLYDLLNSAREHGFKEDDNWELIMVTNSERSKIQKDYHPTIAAKIYPEILMKVYHSVKEKLNQSLYKKEQQEGPNILNQDLNYLVAYNLKRPRT